MRWTDFFEKWFINLKLEMYIIKNKRIEVYDIKKYYELHFELHI